MATGKQIIGNLGESGIRRVGVRVPFERVAEGRVGRMWRQQARAPWVRNLGVRQGQCMGA